MLAMATNGLYLAKVAAHFPDSRLWKFLAYESDHAIWRGCSFWDLIMPAFLFMVGVALPYSAASRLARGESFARRFGHTLYRCVVLIVLGMFIFSNGQDRTYFTFMNVLTQIGLGYWLVFLLAGRGPRLQLAAAGAVLAGTWLVFALHPLPPPGFDFASFGVPKDWEHLTGFARHWDRGTNFGAAVDRRFLAVFPLCRPPRWLQGGGQTINFVPSIATMIFGLLTGGMLRADLPAEAKMKRMLLAGAACLGLGVVLDPSILPFFVFHSFPVLCPIVKRIWTPSYAIFSAGWVLWMLAGFYAVIEIAGFRRWAFPLVLVGTNSIAMYCLAAMAQPWIKQNLKTHLGFTGIFAGTYGPIVESAASVFILWLACLWLYRRRIFLKI